MKKPMNVKAKLKKGMIVGDLYKYIVINDATEAGYCDVRSIGTDGKENGGSIYLRQCNSNFRYVLSGGKRETPRQKIKSLTEKVAELEAAALKARTDYSTANDRVRDENRVSMRRWEDRCNSFVSESKAYAEKNGTLTAAVSRQAVTISAMKRQIELMGEALKVSQGAM